MNITHERLILLADKHNIQWCDNYGERGYSHSSKGLLFSNWNQVPKHVQSGLGKHYELLWSDEWYIDYNRSKAYRTSPDSYSWTPSVVFWECEPLTIDDAKDCPKSYLELLHNDADRVDCFNILNKSSAQKLGYSLVQDDFESGWHNRNDEPRKILNELLERNPDGIYVFAGLSNEQFRSNFSIYKKDI